MTPATAPPCSETPQAPCSGHFLQISSYDLPEGAHQRASCGCGGHTSTSSPASPYLAGDSGCLAAMPCNLPDLIIRRDCFVGQIPSQSPLLLSVMLLLSDLGVPNLCPRKSGHPSLMSQTKSGKPKKETYSMCPHWEEGKKEPADGRGTHIFTPHQEGRSSTFSFRSGMLSRLRSGMLSRRRGSEAYSERE